MTIASAPAKVILFGEHAVVYGQPAIAVPVSALRATATVTPSESGSGLHIVAADLDATLPLNIESSLVDNALIQTAKLTLQALNCPAPDITVTLQSQIPMASGLGSGAAVSAALARAISAHGNTLTDEAINAIVYEVEKLHHGTPSGIDNTVIVYEQPIYFVRGAPIERIAIRTPFTLLIGDTGKGALTRISIAGVRAHYDAYPERTTRVLDDIGALVRDARAAIESGAVEALGGLMTRNHALLRDLTVSSPELDALVQAALDAGALGAKLSGGGRGGNMIALVTDETAPRIREALTRAGAVRIFQTTVQ